MNAQTLSLIQTVVLSLTLIAVIYYTVEAARLRRQMVRQNNLQVRPIVLPELNRGQLSVHNVGLGCALNVNLSCKTGLKFKVQFDNAYFLPPHEKSDIRAVGEVTHAAIRVEDRKQFTELTTHFEDVEGQKYRVQCEIDFASDSTISHRITVGSIERVG